MLQNWCTKIWFLTPFHWKWPFSGQKWSFSGQKWPFPGQKLPLKWLLWPKVPFLWNQCKPPCLKSTHFIRKHLYYQNLWTTNWFNAPFSWKWPFFGPNWLQKMAIMAFNSIFMHNCKPPYLRSTQYQPSGKGGTRSPPATPHRLQNPKWPPGGPKMADGVWKGVYP